MPFIDFAALKEKVSIEQAAQYLGLELKQSAKQLRGPCPACNGSNVRGLAITPDKGLFYCFSSEQGGDCIKLVAHIRGIKQQEAAQELAQQFDRTVVATPPQPEKTGTNPSTCPTLDYLQADHPAVEAVGFSADTAKALGIGYAAKGLMRGMVAVPIRLEDGTISGYIGITEARLPPRFQLTTNVVPLHPKKTA